MSMKWKYLGRKNSKRNKKKMRDNKKYFQSKHKNCLGPRDDFQSSDPTAEGLKPETQAGRNLPNQNVKFSSAEKIFLKISIEVTSKYLLQNKSTLNRLRFKHPDTQAVTPRARLCGTSNSRFKNFFFWLRKVRNLPLTGTFSFKTRPKSCARSKGRL